MALTEHGGSGHTRCPVGADVLERDHSLPGAHIWRDDGGSVSACSIPGAQAVTCCQRRSSRGASSSSACEGGGDDDHVRGATSLRRRWQQGGRGQVPADLRSVRGHAAKGRSGVCGRRQRK